MTTSVLYSALPYAALLVLGGGLFVRYVSTSTRGADLDVEVAEAWALFGGGKIWRAGFVALGLLHLAIMLLPQVILSWNGVPLRLYLLEGSGFAFGLLALGWWAGAMRRHFQRSSEAAASEVADCVFLSLVFVGIVSGLLTATLYRWGSSWGAATLAPYGSSLLRSAPLVSFVDQMPLLVQLHVVSMFALMIAFPFTRAASFVTFAARWAFGLPTAPLSAVSGVARAWLDRHDPATWIWPEDAWEDGEVRAPLMARAPSAASTPTFATLKLPAATEPRQSAPTLPPHSGVRETADGISLEADAAMEKAGSDVG
jgi:nitrate reductase gamma subunit